MGQRMVNSFFCKRMNYWLFVYCHRPLAFAMTKGQGVVFTNSSLRELLATRGNLSMGYNYSFMEFFFFSVFVFIISGCGLLRRFTPSNDEEQ